MNAGATIAAAIQKLETAKAGDGFCIGSWQYLRKGSWGGESAVADSNGHPLAWVGDGDDADRDAELIVTLHRTIDAQLEILRFGLKRQEAVDWTRRIAGDKQTFAASLEIDLARAILGDVS